MTQSNTYINPILPGNHPDPSIIRSGDDYFLITSSFEYFPGIPIYHSTDLISWRHISHALTRRSQLDIRTPEPGGGIWAPTIREHDGWFYITAACFDRYRPQEDERIWPRGFYVKCKAEVVFGGDWSDPVWFDEVGFDQDLFFDDDGKVYLSTTRRKHERTLGRSLKDFAIHISTVDLSTGASTSTPKVIRSSTSGIAEGSHIFKRGKFHYLFTAEGGTESGHCEWASRSSNGPLGPWEIGSAPLWKIGTEDDEVVNTGHVDIVEDKDGNWWAVMLACRPIKLPDGVKTFPGMPGRETFLVPMNWENDWPVMNNGNKVALEGEGPGLYRLQRPVRWRDEFMHPELELGWYRKNTPQKRDYEITTNPSGLRLVGSPYALSSPACPTLFLRKQTSRVGVWSTRLSFHPTSRHMKAGTVVYWNYLTYASIDVYSYPWDVSKRAIEFNLVLNGKEAWIVMGKLKTEGDVILYIWCTDDGYKLGYRPCDEKNEKVISWIGEATVDEITADPPIGAAFMGMMLGLYATGNGDSGMVSADFKFAEFDTLHEPDPIVIEPLTCCR
ncbi:glycoside hydrolase family 43 protein [Sclerotinia borealis F-4128]|uniref:Glycoside hydrolase family 43 protein n=1 Tax=Sclerotinia borealis (strain F-4128) TaxID=1432307 RepID=W9CTW2_SCLBF|nr:glycoside hydrolase family 43 protein [Sclerotinia borealis F-4128]